jgi:hypothetical protein
MSDKQGRDRLIPTRFIMLLPHPRMNFAHMGNITAVLDMGATRSVLGLRAARHIMRAAGKNLSSPLPIAFFDLACNYTVLLVTYTSIFPHLLVSLQL